MKTFAKIAAGHMLALGVLSGTAAADSIGLIPMPSESFGWTLPGAVSPLKDGKTYQIINVASGRCLDVFDHLLTENNPIKQWDCTGENHQKFIAHQVLPGGVYSFSTLRTPQFYLASNPVESTNGTPIVQSATSELYRNLFLEELADGAFTIGFPHSGLCLDVDNHNGLGNGAKVQQWDCSGQENQQWRFKEVSVADQVKTYQLKNKMSGLCLDVPGHSLENDVQLQQYSCQGGDNQAFRLVQGEGDQVFIRALHSNKAVVVEHDEKGNGAKVIQFRVRPEVIPSSIQSLVPVKGKKDTYQVRFAHSNFCLTVPYSSKNNGTKIYQNSCVYGDAQEWELVSRD